MFCFSCGERIEDDSVFCEKCGARISDGLVDELCPSQASMTVGASVSQQPSFNATTPEESTGRNNKTLIIGGAIAVVAVVTVIVVAAIFLGKPVSSPVNQSVVQQDQPANTNQNASPQSEMTIPLDTSKAFWGVWTLASKDEAEARVFAKELSDKGYTSDVQLTSKWEKLNTANLYAVTTGTWSSKEDADKMVEVLKKAGYGDAYSKYTGNPVDPTREVTLNVKTATGESLSGKVHKNSNGYVLEGSSTRQYSVSEISSLNLSGAELCIAWNEPFARGGYHFKNPGLQAYFEGCSWYHDLGKSFSLSGVEATNNENLRKVAERSPESAKWMNLATS